MPSFFKSYFYFIGVNEFHESASSSFAKDLCYEVPSKLQNISRESSLLYSLNDKSVLKQEKDVSVDSAAVDTSQTKLEADVSAASDYLENASEEKTSSQIGECTSTCTKTNASNSEHVQSQSESAVLHTDPGTETFPSDSETSQASSFR